MSTASSTALGQYQHSYANSASTSTTPAQPRPTSQSSSHSAPSFSNAARPSQYATPQSIPRKRPFYETRPPPHYHQRSVSSGSSSKNPVQSSGLAEVVAIARTAVATSESRSRQAPGPRIATSSPATISVPKPGDRASPTSEPKSVAQVAVRQREESAGRRAATHSEEPPLKLGEAPSMTLHPNLIAQMVARKRAEAEMLGHRERWARRQQEYRMSRSPGAQLTHELNARVSHSDARGPQPRTVSNPLPARSAPVILDLQAPTPIVFNTQPPIIQNPTAETVCTPATDNSTKPAAAKNERQHSNDNDSLFGSPFSTPIVEFLENATDEAGLKDALEPNKVVPTRTSAGNTAVSTPQPSDPTVPSTSSAAEATSRSQARSEIPPLFSDKTPTTHHQTSSSSETPTHAQTTANHQQPQSESPTGAVADHAPAHPEQPGPWPQLAPRQPPTSRAIPYYPQQAGMPAYYRVANNQHWLGDGRNLAATPTVTPPTANAYRQAAPPPNMGFTGYNLNPINPYMMPSPGLPPPPGPLRTYGTTVAAAAAERQKQQAFNAGYLTAADHAAGINLKFHNTTKSGFSVPKR
ncbi:hypothetical protein G647_01637 [Cladophialophora carrionii CBS 160.54]|uniref:Uncharacterized protein n=1 Tax=Cladophialophora carrionii CBS 160.54 TaxID=1279043 RepID=V9DQJ6_9EURO|nr:uncharacterized protein G647_01637 [Cladophialophora carrionii CBS 160.54]ETI29184.1 hypothetical protein G647_01637 [Cladophialophora carrionii CBS 160.54]